jgi:hypothetical protein
LMLFQNVFSIVTCSAFFTNIWPINFFILVMLI